MSAFGKADIRGLLPKRQSAAHFYELGLVEDGNVIAIATYPRHTKVPFIILWVVGSHIEPL